MPVPSTTSRRIRAGPGGSGTGCTTPSYPCAARKPARRGSWLERPAGRVNRGSQSTSPITPVPPRRVSPTTTTWRERTIAEIVCSTGTCCTASRTSRSTSRVGGSTWGTTIGGTTHTGRGAQATAYRPVERLRTAAVLGDHGPQVFGHGRPDRGGQAVHLAQVLLPQRLGRSCQGGGVEPGEHRILGEDLLQHAGPPGQVEFGTH